MSAEYKQCSDCRFVLPVADFYRAPLHADGLFSCCKVCGIERSLRWAAEHPERARVQGRLSSQRYRDRKKAEAAS